MQVYAGMYAPVVAGGSSRADVVRLFDEEHAYIQTGKFARQRAPHDASAHDEHVGTLPFQRPIAQRGLFHLLDEPFQTDVVEHPEGLPRDRRHAATIDGVPAVQLPREPHATAVLLHLDGGRYLMNSFCDSFQIHRSTSRDRFFPLACAGARPHTRRISAHATWKAR